MNARIVKTLCAITLCVILSLPFISIQGLPQAGSESDMASNADSLIGVTDQMPDPLLQLDKPVDSSGILDFIELLNSKGGTISGSDWRTTNYYDILGNGIHVEFDISSTKITIEVSIGSYSILGHSFDEGDFKSVQIPGCEVSTIAGTPALPYRKLLLPIPAGASIYSIDSRVVQSETFYGLRIVPSPRPLAIFDSGPIDRSLYFDDEVYSVDEYTRTQSIEYDLVRRGNHNGLLLSVFPLKYNPSGKTGELALRTEIEVSFDRDFSPDEVVFQTSGHALAGAGNYTVIAPESFIASLSSFVAWKTTLGFDVFVESLEDICEQFPTGDGPTRVRDFIKASYIENSTDYILLVGDADVVPVREVVDPAAGPGLDNGTEPTDLYYECLDGTWDANGNGLYGELDDEVDLMPELMVGRIPVKTPEQARSVLAQIIRYEQNPEPGDWFNDFMIIANDCFGIGDGPVMTEALLNQRYLYDSFFDVFRFYSTDNSLTTENVVSRINSGVSIIDFFDHGAYDQWSGALWTSDVEGLTNGNRTMLAFAMACETAAFDVESVDPTISEAFFRNPNGGAHTYIGATRVAWAGYDCFDGFHNAFWASFFETALELREVSPKVAMQQALEHMVTTFDMNSGPTLETVYQAIYFGDPSLRMYWKHDVSIETEETEVETTTELNGTCLLHNGANPIVGAVDVTITDPRGGVVYDDSVVTNVFGQYSISFDTSSVPGIYRVSNRISTPFSYEAIDTFVVGSMTVTVGLDAAPVYNTFLPFSGTVGDDCSGMARILDSDYTVLQEVALTSSGGVFSSSMNVTGFGDLTLQIEFENGTASGGTQVQLRVNRGDILIIADDTGSYGPTYPGGWADSNIGDASNPGDYLVALGDEYNVTLFFTIYDASPSIGLLNQYDAVVVSTGDNFGLPLVSPNSYLLDVLNDYSNMGGDILYEGGSLFTPLQPVDRAQLGSMASVGYVEQVTNTGGLNLVKVSHPIMSGLPGTIPLASGLGSVYAEVVTPAGRSQTVGSYSGDHVGSSAITAISANATRGGAVFVGFSIDAIEDEAHRNVLIQNAIAFLLHPSLFVTLSDDALMTGTTETVQIEVEDSATGTPLGGVHVSFEGSGVSVTNVTQPDGTCSVFIAPTFEGLIVVEATKGGYLNYTTEIIVYDKPVVALEAFPSYLERSGSQEVAVLATDFYERFPLEGCFINLTGLGNSFTGATNSSGLINFVVTPDSPGVISITGNFSGYVNATISLAVRVSILVLPGLGTYSPEYCCWDELMLNWRKYGDFPLDIDYTTFANQSLRVSFDILESIGAEVLLMGFPFYEFSAEEIDAIQLYVQTGAGLVATTGAMLYNTAQWSLFFGLEEISSMNYHTPSSLSIDLISVTHPVLRDVANPYSPSYPLSFYPVGTGWSIDILRGASYIAIEDDALPQAAVFTYRGMVYISNIPEYMSGTDDCQIIYNSITWSKYVMPEHDLAVTLDVPSGIAPGDTETLTVTARNLGLNNETDVDLFLYIEGSLVSTASVAQLNVGSTYNITYLWNPLEEGIYNVTAYVGVKPGEETTLNNVVSRNVMVRELHNYHMIDGPFLWLDAKENGESIGLYGDDNYANIALPFLFKYYDNVFDTLSISTNGWLSFGVTDPWEYNCRPFPSNDPRLAYALAPLWADLHSVDNVYVWSTEQWVVIQFDNYEYLGGQTAGTFEVVLYADGHIGFYYLHMQAVFYGTVGLNYGDGMIGNSYVAEALSGAVGFGLEFYYTLPEHELAVALSCSTIVNPDESVPVNLRVFNIGTNDEYDLDLDLFIQGENVFSISIPVAESGQSYDFVHNWTVPSIGEFNLTAYLSPVPDEAVLENNLVQLTVRASYLIDYTMLEDTFTWYDAVENGYNLNMIGDDTYEIVNLPFDFIFYDTSFDQVAISSNGWLSFTNMHPYDCSPVAFPSSDSRYSYSFAPIWADLKAENNVYLWSTAEFVVIQYNEYNYLWEDPLGTFEVVLHAGGFLEFNYMSMETVHYGTVGLNYGDGVHHNAYYSESLSDVDEFGLMFVYDDGVAPEWIETPTDFIEEAGELFTHAFHVHDDTGIVSFTTNDTRFSVTTSGVLSNTQRLHVGQYGLRLVATDPGGHWVSANITVIIVDTKGPIWDSMVVHLELTSGDALEMNVIAYDFSGVAGFIVNRTGFTVNASGYLINTAPLWAGIYVIGVEAIDNYGNTNMLSVVLTVRQSPEGEFIFLLLVTFVAVAALGLITVIMAKKIISRK